MNKRIYKKTKSDTDVVNVRKENFTVYIGRGAGGTAHIMNSTVGERGWLGNPFPLSKYSRKESINEYRKVFYKKINSDPEFKAAVKDLKGEILGCYCKPKDCHGDVIAEYLNKLDISADADRTSLVAEKEVGKKSVSDVEEGTEMGYMAEMCPGIKRMLVSEYDMTAEERRLAYNKLHVGSVGSPWLEEELEEIEASDVTMPTPDADVIEDIMKFEEESKSIDPRKAKMIKRSGGLRYRFPPTEKYYPRIVSERSTGKDVTPVEKVDPPKRKDGFYGWRL